MWYYGNYSDEPIGMTRAERELWRYEHDENFGCYDVGSRLDSQYQRLREEVEEERRGNRR